MTSKIAMWPKLMFIRPRNLYIFTRIVFFSFIELNKLYKCVNEYTSQSLRLPSSISLFGCRLYSSVVYAHAWHLVSVSFRCRKLYNSKTKVANYATHVSMNIQATDYVEPEHWIACEMFVKIKDNRYTTTLTNVLNNKIDVWCLDDQYWFSIFSSQFTYFLIHNCRRWTALDTRSGSRPGWRHCSRNTFHRWDTDSMNKPCDLHM